MSDLRSSSKNNTSLLKIENQRMQAFQPARKVLGLASALSGLGFGISLVSSGFSFLTLGFLASGICLFVFSRILRSQNRERIISEQESRRFKERIRKIKKARYLEHAEGWGIKIADQCVEIEERLKAFDAMLALKFDASELAFSRYRSVALETFFALIDRLEFALHLLHLVEAMPLNDPKESESCLSARQKTIVSIQEIFTSNQEMIDSFDHLSLAVSNIQTGAMPDEQELGILRDKLSRLIERAKDYDHS